MRSERELQAIIGLLRQNLTGSVSAAEARSQGFLTAVYTLPALREMHAQMPSLVARRAGMVVGYALALPLAARGLVPEFDPMFELFPRLSFRGRPLIQQDFYVMGQVCVARGARAQGVFDALYAGHRAHYASRFGCIVTEVATRNTRSLRAHARVGFEILHVYRDAIDEWALVAWDFGARSRGASGTTCRVP
ncbi:MAG: GNAT family N-acetyltransferase [Myxococcales bacterium]